jgi:hypothetical protein
MHGEIAHTHTRDATPPHPIHARPIYYTRPSYILYTPVHYSDACAIRVLVNACASEGRL